MRKGKFLTISQYSYINYIWKKQNAPLTCRSFVHVGVFSLFALNITRVHIIYPHVANVRPNIVKSLVPFVGS